MKTRLLNAIVLAFFALVVANVSATRRDDTAQHAAKRQKILNENHITQGVACSVASHLAMPDFATFSRINRAFAECLRHPGVVARVVINTEPAAPLKYALKHGINNLAILARVAALSPHADTEALGFAVYQNRIDWIQLLVYDLALDVNAHQGEALAISAWENHYDAASVLLAAGADVNAGGNEALKIAVMRGNARMVDLFLIHGARCDKHEPLRIAARNGATEIVGMLLDRWNVSGGALDDLLVIAAKHGHHPIVQLLTQRHADVDTRDGLAMRLSAANGHSDVLQALIIAGGNIHANDDEALRSAVYGDHVYCVMTLLGANANVGALNQQALYTAIEKDSLVTVTFLLAFNANPQHADHEPLHWALKLGHTHMIDLLMLGIRCCNSH
jgi:ankyrin repeat protein